MDGEKKGFATSLHVVHFSPIVKARDALFQLPYTLFQNNPVFALLQIVRLNDITQRKNLQTIPRVTSRNFRPTSYYCAFILMGFLVMFV